MSGRSSSVDAAHELTEPFTPLRASLALAQGFVKRFPTSFLVLRPVARLFILCACLRGSEQRQPCHVRDCTLNDPRNGGGLGGEAGAGGKMVTP